MKYGKRRSQRRLVLSPLLTVGLLIIMIILAKAAWNIRQKALLSANRLAAAQVELAKLKSHQQELEKHVDYLSSEQGIEAELRTKYRAIKQGESVAVIVDDEATAAALGASSSAIILSEPKASWWQSLFHSLGF